MDNKTDQVLFKLGNLAKMLEVESSVLRFWEKEFNIKALKVGPNKKLYRPQELAQFKQIKYLLYEKLFTIAGAKNQLKNGELTDIIIDNKVDSGPKIIIGNQGNVVTQEVKAKPLEKALGVLAETRLGLLEIKQMLINQRHIPTPNPLEAIPSNNINNSKGSNNSNNSNNSKGSSGSSGNSGNSK